MTKNHVSRFSNYMIQWLYSLVATRNKKQGEKQTWGFGFFSNTEPVGSDLNFCMWSQ